MNDNKCENQEHKSVQRHLRLRLMTVLVLAMGFTGAITTAGAFSASDFPTEPTAPMMPCEMFAGAMTQAHLQNTGNEASAAKAGEEALAWCLPQGGAPAFTGGSLNLTLNLQTNVIEHLDPEEWANDKLGSIKFNVNIPGPPGRCYTSSPDAGSETTVCGIWCGWRTRKAIYISELTATSGDLDKAPLIYAGVGCSNDGFMHAPPVGVACGEFAYWCQGRYDEGVKLQWGTCVFGAYGSFPHVTDAHCSWDKPSSQA